MLMDSYACTMLLHAIDVISGVFTCYAAGFFVRNGTYLGIAGRYMGSPHTERNRSSLEGPVVLEPPQYHYDLVDHVDLECQGGLEVLV